MPSDTWHRCFLLRAEICAHAERIQCVLAYCARDWDRRFKEDLREVGVDEQTRTKLNKAGKQNV
jgi:hypothetical protein